jgi:hypothetical protein
MLPPDLSASSVAAIRLANTGIIVLSECVILLYWKAVAIGKGKSAYQGGALIRSLT